MSLDSYIRATRAIANEFAEMLDGREAELDALLAEFDLGEWSAWRERNMPAVVGVVAAAPKKRDGLLRKASPNLLLVFAAYQHCLLAEATLQLVENRMRVGISNRDMASDAGVLGSEIQEFGNDLWPFDRRPPFKGLRQGGK